MRNIKFIETPIPTIKKITRKRWRLKFWKKQLGFGERTPMNIFLGKAT